MEQLPAFIVGEGATWHAWVWSKFVELLSRIPDWEGKHGHAHTVFLELSVAFNTALVTFKDLREYKRSPVTKLVKDQVDQMETWRRDAKIPELEKLIQTVKEAYARCEGRQDRMFRICEYLAIASACAGAWIIYADWIDAVGWACGLAILPFPVYWVVTTYDYRFCRKTCKREYARFQTLTQFVPSVNDLVGGLIGNGTVKDG